MGDNITTQTPERTRIRTWKRVMYFFMAFVMLFTCLPMEAFADWDGSGSSGDSNAGNIEDGYALSYASTKDIIGYRISVYDESGDKMGYSIDVDFYISSVAPKRSYGGNKQSHIDLYRAYVDYYNGGKFNGPEVSLGTLDTDRTEASYVYNYSTIEAYMKTMGVEPEVAMPDTQSDPTLMRQWVTEDTSAIIANYCGVSKASFATTEPYIIVEPLFAAFLDGNVLYALTMAELAVFQARTVEQARTAYNEDNPGTYSDTNGWNYVRPYSSEYGLYMNNIGRITSGVYGRYLYATGKYTALGTSKVEDSFLVTDDRALTIQLPNADTGGSSYVVRNTAADILKYQIGMAIYTENNEDDQYTLTVDPNGGDWTPPDSSWIDNGDGTYSKMYMHTDDTVTVPAPTSSLQKTFKQWTKDNGTCSISGTTYTQGTGDCTLVAQWEDNRPYYTVEVIAGDGIQSVSGGGSYREGDTVTISADPKDHYTWKNWTGYQSASEQTYTFTMPGI